MDGRRQQGPAVLYYTQHAKELSEQYQYADPEQVHAPWHHHLPITPGLACDIGPGSGRGACWLASKGWEVFAVEPNHAMREIAQTKATANQNLATGLATRLNDKLPELKQLRIAEHRFNLILISAVWMHLSEPDRARAMRIVSELLAPGGLFVISLQHNTTSGAARNEEFAVFMTLVPAK